MKKKSAHTKALEKIIKDPSKFGIENVKCVAIEPTLYNSKGNPIAAPDIVFLCKRGDVSEVFIVEYKGNGNGEYLHKANKQITTAVGWFARFTPYDLKDIHSKIICGDDFNYKKKFREIT